MGLAGKLKTLFFGAGLAKLNILVDWGGRGIFEPLFGLGESAPLFNPNEISIQKSVTWDNAPKKQSNIGEASFSYGEPQTLGIDLYFDTYEGLPSTGSSLLSISVPDPLALYPLSDPAAVDVRKYTAEVYKLTEIKGDLGRPPICKLTWGLFDDFFKGYITSLTQKFTLFLPSGLPVRAILTCNFTEWRSDAEDNRKQNPASALDDDPIRIVRRGDTLQSIAAEEYKDPQLWRPIAQANRIVNPRALQPGQVLTIPVLDAYLNRRES